MCMFTTCSGGTPKCLGTGLSVLALLKCVSLHVWMQWTQKSSIPQSWAKEYAPFLGTEERRSDWKPHLKQPVSNSKEIPDAGVSPGLSCWRASNSLACHIRNDKLQRKPIQLGKWSSLSYIQSNPSCHTILKEMQSEHFFLAILLENKDDTYGHLMGIILYHKSCSIWSLLKRKMS